VCGAASRTVGAAVSIAASDSAVELVGTSLVADVTDGVGADAADGGVAVVPSSVDAQAPRAHAPMATTTAMDRISCPTPQTSCGRRR
jgi:hypothetical protein